MPTVKRLMQQANPVRNDVDHDLRAVEDRLTGLLVHGPATRAPAARGSRRRLIVAAAVAATIAVAGGAGVVVMRGSAPPPTANEPFFATAEKLEARADTIVRGTIDSTRNVTQEGVAETVATVTVQKVAKGDVSTGTPIQISYTPVGSGPETPVGLRRGGEYVFLLQRRDPTGWNLVSSTQGYYIVTSGTLTAAEGNPVALSSLTRRKLGLS